MLILVGVYRKKSIYIYLEYTDIFLYPYILSGYSVYVCSFEKHGGINAHWPIYFVYQTVIKLRNESQIRVYQFEKREFVHSLL